MEPNCLADSHLPDSHLPDYLFQADVYYYVFRLLCVMIEYKPLYFHLAMRLECPFLPLLPILDNCCG